VSMKTSSLRLLSSDERAIADLAPHDLVVLVLTSAADKQGAKALAFVPNALLVSTQLLGAFVIKCANLSRLIDRGDTPYLASPSAHSLQWSCDR
jgi:hypothetical protein